MSLVDYSEYATAIETAETGKILPDRTECIIRLIGKREGTSEKTTDSGDTLNRDYIILTFDVPEEPLAYNIDHFMWAPSTYRVLDAKDLNSAQYSMRCLAQALGIDLSRPFAWEDHFGKECSAMLGIKKGQGDFQDRNSIRKFI